MDGSHEVWAVTSSGDEPTLRYTGPEYQAITEAAWIARQSYPDGAVSVWVESPSGAIWAAGEKARSLVEEGHRIESDGRVFAQAPA